MILVSIILGEGDIERGYGGIRVGYELINVRISGLESLMTEFINSAEDK